MSDWTRQKYEVCIETHPMHTSNRVRMVATACVRADSLAEAARRVAHDDGDGIYDIGNPHRFQSKADPWTYYRVRRLARPLKRR